MAQHASTNPRRILPKPREPGAALGIVHHERRHKSIEGRSGFVGTAATIVGATVQTTAGGGDPNNYYPGIVFNSSNFNVYNSAGTLTLQVRASDGAINLLAGTAQYLASGVITWTRNNANSGLAIGSISGAYDSVNVVSQTQVLAKSQIDGTTVMISIGSRQSGSSTSAIQLDTPNYIATLLEDSVGSTSFPGTVTCQSLVQSSHSSLKGEVRGLSPADVLESLRRLRVSEWEFIEHPGARHVGPMAEEFFEEFSLGGPTAFGKGPHEIIAPLDVAGVALLGVQGLADQLEVVESQLAALRQDHPGVDKAKVLAEEIQHFRSMLQTI